MTLPTFRGVYKPSPLGNHSQRVVRDPPIVAGDERSTDAVAWSHRGIGRILRILDGYTITERTAGPVKDDPE